MMNFRVQLKGTKKLSNSRFKLDLEKLKHPTISEEFQATLGGKFAPLLLLEEDLKSITNTFTEVMTETANEVLGKSQKKAKDMGHKYDFTHV